MMDEFYILRLWVSLSPHDDIGYYPTFRDAEMGLWAAVASRREYCSEDYDTMGEVGYSIVHMENCGNEYLEDKAKQVIYDYKGDIIKDVLMCKTCLNVIRISGRWASSLDELIHQKSNGENCGRCCDKTLKETEARNEETN